MPGGIPGRAAGLRFLPLVEVDEERHVPQGSAQVAATVVVARDRRELDQTLLFLFTAMVTGAILLPLIAAAIVIVAVKRSLRPVDDLSFAMGLVDSPLEAQAFEIETMPTELQPIVFQLNNLMERLRAAFHRERRFTTDASHELRTPLSETRTALEVALKWPDDPQLMKSSCQSALESTRNMQQMIDAMLALARAGSENRSLETEQLDLMAIVKNCWAQIATKADAQAITIDLRNADEPCIVHGNPALTSSIIANLLDNAVEYSVPNSPIEVDLCIDKTKNRHTVSITNTSAESLTDDDIAAMFQPLWRKEASRAAVTQNGSGERAHAGLGLALVDSFCNVLNIGLVAEQPAPGLFRIVLTFPVHPISENSPEKELV